ncbi:hypothetical protein [Streptomyces sp. NPDC056308]|uniref:hypothetical protein n=1 Tax=Streptomyces sp. NPDC056308 TaxID=3345780 RepID=UPI0035E0802E
MSPATPHSPFSPCSAAPSPSSTAPPPPLNAPALALAVAVHLTAFAVFTDDLAFFFSVRTGRR